MVERVREVNVSIKAKKFFSFCFLIGFCDTILRCIDVDPGSDTAFMIFGGAVYHLWLEFTKDLKD